MCFQVIGTSTHIFFPLVYYERLLAFERKILIFIKKIFSKKASSKNSIVGRLEKDILRRESDLPVLHDRMLYKIERTIQVSSSKPEKGYELFKKLQHRLDQEIVKAETWKKHYSTCLYNLGAIANHLGRKEESLKYLYKHLEYDSKSIDARSILSDLFFENEEFEEAIPHTKVCLTAYGNNDTYWFRLGYCYFKIDNYISAYKCFSSMKNRDRNSFFFEARSYSRAGEFERAIESYQILLKHYPKDSDAIFYLASTLAHHGADKKATQIIGLIQEDDPYYARTQVLLGSIFYRSKRIKEANEMFITALKIDPSCVQAMIELAQIAIDVNRRDQATSLLEKVLQIDSENSAANYFAGVLTEMTEEESPINYYKKAAKAYDFKRFAERRLGAHNFFNSKHGEAVVHLANAVDRGEDSIWFLYIYAFALATVNDFSVCQDVLIKIARLSQTDSLWKSKAGSGMYSLGLRLFEKKDFNLALKCFQFVKNKYPIINQSNMIDQLLEEAKFRMVIQLLDKGKFEKGQGTLNELMTESQDAERKNIYNYYLALCFLYQKRFKEAKQILSGLYNSDPNNPHYLYHIIIIELGEARDQEAAKLLIKLREFLSIPEHLRVGMQTIRAYLTAKQGKMRNAEASLASISELNKDFPGADYIRQQVLMSRIFYLCHVRDSRKIHNIIPQLTGDQKRKAILLHAIAAVESGQLKVAKDILKPYTKDSEGNKKLYSTICTDLAIKAISKKDYKGARKIFEEVPDRSEAIENIALLLIMTELLENIGDFESITQAIMELSGYLSKVEDCKLRHSLIHNLAILHLKRAIMAEGTGRWDMVDDLWQSCWQFWMMRVFKSQDYWNSEQDKLRGNSKQGTKRFSQKEVDAIYKRFIDENFVDMFVWYIINYLNEVNETGVTRHLALLRTIGDETGNSKDYFLKLQEGFTVLMRSIDKTNEHFSTWPFYILSTAVQCSISGVLNLNDYDELTRKLDSFKEYSKKYSTPKDYKKVERQFNTSLLHALHLGIDGKFAEAGSKLEKVLNDVFPGILDDDVIEELNSISEVSRQFVKGNSDADQLKRRFEGMYAAITGNKTGLDPDFQDT